MDAVAKVIRRDEAGHAAGCSYDTADGASTIDVVTVTGPEAQQFYDAGATNDGKPGVPMTGIGDKAVRQAGEVWVIALKGDVFCSVSGQHGSTGARGTGEFVGLQAYGTSDDIPDSAAQPVAARLGTLCTKLFAAGG